MQQEEEALHFLDYWRVLKNRKEIILAVILLVSLTGIAITYMMPPTYSATCRIIVEEDKTDVDVFQQSLLPNYNPYYLMTQFQVIKSRPILAEIVNDPNLRLREKWGKLFNEDQSPLEEKKAIDYLEANLDLSQERNTSVMDITVFSREPEEARDIANRISDVYHDHRINMKMGILNRGIGALKKQYEDQLKNVEEAESAVEKIRIDNNLSTLDDETPVDMIEVQRMMSELNQALVEMTDKTGQVKQIEAKSGEELFFTMKHITPDRSLEQLYDQRLQAIVEREQLSRLKGVNHPDIQELDASITKLQSQFDVALAGIKESIINEAERSVQRYHTLSNLVEKVKGDVVGIEAGAMAEYEKALRLREYERAYADSLKDALVRQTVEQEIPRTPIVVFEPAETKPKPVSPNLLLNILLSIGLGTMLGIGLAYFLEYLDTSVRTVDDIERYLELPVIGVIPQRVKLMHLEGPDGPHAEAYRLLRTNMQFSKGQPETSNGTPTRNGVYTIVSAGAGEGKSTTTYNLAYICASMGDRVLLIDSDLRRPVQHTHFDTSNRRGLTDVLLDDVPAEEMILESQHENLFFLPSGKLPRTSIGLIESHKVQQLIQALRPKYDLIFFDAPPIVGVSDASILASEADAVMQVVQYRKYPRNLSARAKRIVENVGGNLIGVVLNNINIMRDDYYSYFDSYYTTNAKNARKEKEPAPALASTSSEARDAF